MSKILIFVLIIIQSGILLAQDWQEYTIEGSDFYVKLPEPPEKKVQEIPSTQGIITMNMLTCIDGQMNFIVSFSDYPATSLNNVNLDSFFIQARDGAVKNIQGKLISEKIIKYNDYPGREIKFSVMEEKAMVKNRFYLVKNRLYQVMAIVDPLQLYTDPVEKYFASFRLTEDAGIPRIEKLLKNIGYTYDTTPKGEYHVTLRFEDQRTHLVRIAPFVSDLTLKELYDIWAIISNDSLAIADSIYTSMLIKNGETSIGKFQLFPKGNKNLLVYSAVFMGELTQEILKKIINDVASIADIYEEQITGADEF